MQATSLAKVSSSIPLSLNQDQTSSALRILGTLMVWGPTPNTASRCSACIKSREFIPVKLQAKQHAAAHIINPALLGAVHCLCVVTVIMLRPCAVKLLIAFLVICLLEQNIGTDSRVLKLPVILHCGGRYVHVDAAYGSIFMLYTVNGVNGLNMYSMGLCRVSLFPEPSAMPHICSATATSCGFHPVSASSLGYACSWRGRDSTHTR